MCKTCGCEAEPKRIVLERKILDRNDQLAETNRRSFGARGILALNVVGGPGAGKTSLLERTIREFGREVAITVVEGDQATANDADRIRAAGAPVVQVNTGAGCHLDASMVARAVETLAPAERSLLLVENVGNLVCPALFDLGERAKVVVASVTDGEDKPIKYPHMFRASALMLLNKIDLAPHVDFDVARCIAYAREVNPTITVIPVSAKTGAGLSDWYAWIQTRRGES